MKSRTGMHYSKLQVKAECTKTSQLLVVLPSCHFKLARMLLCSTMCLDVCGLSQPLLPCSSVGCNRQFLQWHSSVGQFQMFPVVFQCTLQVVDGSSSGTKVYTGSTSAIPVYTVPASVHWLRVRAYLVQRKSTFLSVKVTTRCYLFLCSHAPAQA